MGVHELKVVLKEVDDTSGDTFELLVCECILADDVQALHIIISTRSIQPLITPYPEKGCKHHIEDLDLHLLLNSFDESGEHNIEEIASI